MRHVVLGVCGAVLLAGCGSQPTEGERYLTLLKSLMTQGSAAPADLRASLTPESVAQIGQPLLVARFPARNNAQILFTPSESNGRARSWLSPSLELLVFEAGVLLQTRGAGGDLMGADLEEVRDGIAGRRSEAVRIHRYLDGEDQIVANSFVCDYTRQPDSVSAYFRQQSATRVDELCTGLNYSFENQYWVDGAGRVLRSVEWVSEAVGYVDIERLSD